MQTRAPCQGRQAVAATATDDGDDDMGGAGGVEANAPEEEGPAGSTPGPTQEALGVSSTLPFRALRLSLSLELVREHMAQPAFSSQRPRFRRPRRRLFNLHALFLPSRLPMNHAFANDWGGQ